MTNKKKCYAACDKRKLEDKQWLYFSLTFIISLQCVRVEEEKKMFCIKVTLSPHLFPSLPPCHTYWSSSILVLYFSLSFRINFLHIFSFNYFYF